MAFVEAGLPAFALRVSRKLLRGLAEARGASCCEQRWTARRCATGHGGANRLRQGYGGPPAGLRALRYGGPPGSPPKGELFSGAGGPPPPRFRPPSAPGG